MKIAKCIYCNELTEITRDHIPPSSFFPSPKPSNLITVDCCENCNKSFALDDEYMLYILAMKHDVSGHRIGKLHSKKIDRMLRKPSKLSFIKMIENKTERVDLYTPGGIYLCQVDKYTPDMERIKRFMKRITTGLFSFETKRILPSDNKFDLWDYQGVMKQTEEFREKMLPVLLDLKEMEKKIIGDGVFSYSYRLFDDKLNTFICLIIFFDFVRFLCITTPNNK